MTPSGSGLSTPVFQPTSEDLPRLARITHQLDTKALQCVEAANCEPVYFSRALVSLFEDREAARASFRHVIEHNVASPLARHSTLWLQLIENQDRTVPSNSTEFRALTELAADFVREWMDRVLTEQPAVASPLPIIQDPTIDEQPRIVRELQKRLRQRDRQISFLQSQLEALRLIDQDHSERKRQPRVPTTF